MEKRSLEDGPAWKPTRQAEILRDRMKFRLGDEGSKRNLKAQNLRVPSMVLQGQDVGSRSSSSSSLKLGQVGLAGNLMRMEETTCLGLKPKRTADLTMLQSVELEAKETQTKEKWEEKGLQVSMGRQVSRAAPVLAVTSSQTETPALAARLKEKRPHFLVLALTLLSLLTVFLGFHVGSHLWVRSLREPPLKTPTFWKRMFTSVGWILHSCSHCSSHR